ncbi:MAG: transcriptional regulator Spx [Ileibacterium sp.]|nr:transcriptional regulator Spx [Ileibacterium sp.]
MVLFYTSPGCASCRKAKRWLEDNHIDFLEKNIFSNLLSENEIKYLMSRCENGTEDIISTRSKAFSNLKENLDDLSTKQLTRFIQQNPSVLKRPILLSKRSMVIGYDDDEITSMIPHERRKEDEASTVAERKIASLSITL